MKLLTYSVKKQNRLGILLEDKNEEKVLDLKKGFDFYKDRQGIKENTFLIKELPNDMLSFLKLEEKGTKAVDQMLDFYKKYGGILEEGITFKLEEVNLKAPILNPPKVICLGRNYSSHVGEGGLKVPEYPKIFPKYSCVIIGPNEAIIKPNMSEQVDFEAELAFVIGKEANYVSEKDALSYVAGYTILHDVSARDIQFKDEQLTLGKNFKTFAPIGPYFVTSDEINDPHNLNIKLWLNDHIMQESNTKYQIFKIPFIISFLSKVLPLEVGDIISTGTPEGIGFFRKPPIFMVPGDKVKIEIEKIGILENHIVSES